MSQHVIANVPYIFQGIVPHCHVTSLMMILEFYGMKYSTSYLMNLSGFNYGFNYFKGRSLAFACPETTLGPSRFMAYAAEKIGCKVSLIKDKPWDETWGLLKGYVDNNVPVYMSLLNMQHLWKTARPVPHIVVLCGYNEEKNVVMIHDPALGEVGEGIQYLGPNGLAEGKFGNYAEFAIDDFRRACDLRGTPWQSFGINGLCIIHPPTRQLNISWAEVVDRNARLTLGKIEEVIGEHAGTDTVSGPDGIMAFAGDLERGFGLIEEPEKLVTILSGQIRNLVFNVGSSYKIDAHAFVAGLASVTGNQDLERASYFIRLTALCYEQALTQVDYMMQNQQTPQKELRRSLNRIAELLRQAAESERKAGESLIRGARALT